MTNRRLRTRAAQGGWASWSASGLLVAFAGLILARYLPPSHFVVGLLLIPFGIGQSAFAILFVVLRRAGLRREWVTTLLSGLGAVTTILGKKVLASRLTEDPPVPTIDFPSIVAGSLSVLGALVAVAAGLWRLRLGRPSILQTGTIAVAVTLALYSLGPLLASAGVPLNHWTLVALCAVALLGALLAHIFSRR